ncbi:MAG: hypothetical protein NT038_11060 [Euryarchaeota archaeon]|nr:hypothetical protein [Euryarchaeota archaeon]
MDEIKNSDIIRQILKALYAVASRRESQLFAAMAMDSIIQTLREEYTFLKYVTVQIKEGVMFDSHDVVIDVSSDIVDNIEPPVVGEVIESLIRVVLLDLGAKGGLFFINEFKKQIGPDYMPELRRLGVNLGNMQLEQRYLYARMEKDKPAIYTPSTATERREETEKKKTDPESIFGYEMGNVTSWEYNKETMSYDLYDKDGKTVDQLDLDTIVKKLTKVIESDSEGFDASSTKEDQHKIHGEIGIFDESTTASSEVEKSENKSKQKIDITKKEYQFLEMLFEQDLELERAIELLKVSVDDLKYMVKRLLGFNILKYVSNDEVELTEFGINYMMSLYGA